MMLIKTLGLVLLICVSGNGEVVAPVGMISMFDGNCPLGYAAFTGAQGKLILSTTNPAHNGANTDSLGISSLSGEVQPSHNHGFERPVCAIAPFGSVNRRTGGLETRVTTSGTVIHCDATGSGTVGSTSLTYDFAQMRLCKSTAQQTVPVGTVAYFDTEFSSCPSGWTGFSESHGRFLFPKKTTESNQGTLVGGNAAFDTSAITPNKHFHGLSTTRDFGNADNYGSGSNYAFATWQQTESFSGLSSEEDLNIPYRQMLTCKATTSNAGLAKNPPAGTIMYFDDSLSGACPATWNDETTYPGNFVVGLPSAESPKVWASSTSSLGAGTHSSHQHATTAFLQISKVTHTFTCCAPLLNSVLYKDISGTYQNDFTSSISFQAVWNACPSNTGSCNPGSGLHLVRYGKFEGGRTFSSTSNGEKQYNYFVINGAFDCSTSALGNPVVGGDPSTYTCEYANLDEGLPRLGMRLCKSTGFLETIAPTKIPTKSPTLSPSISPTKSPTSGPTTNPSVAPSKGPTRVPTDSPSKNPTKTPTRSPTLSPSISPSKSPTFGPTTNPSAAPSKGPTTAPTQAPSKSPSESPTESPSRSPTNNPTGNPTPKPTRGPTNLGETFAPTEEPTVAPTLDPTNAPTLSPTPKPSAAPTPKENADGSIVDKPWFIPSIGGAGVLMAVLLASVAFVKLRRRRSTKSQVGDHHPKINYETML